MDKKAVLLLMILSTWVILMIGPSWAVSDLDLTSTNPTSYTNCIASLRKEAQDPKLKYFNIPMLPESSASLKPKYLFVKLVSKDGTINIAIKRTNLYMLGYSDEDGKRAHFFQDVEKNVRNDLFKDAKENKRLEMSFESNYQSIEIKVKTNREKFGLGIQKLNNKVGKIYNKDVKMASVQTYQAEMFLLAIQMISEAARFSYIEKQVSSPQHFDMFEFIPDAKFIRLQNRWGKLSTAIKGADPKTKVFKNPVDLVKPDGSDFIAKNVDDVKDDIVLLNYVN